MTKLQQVRVKIIEAVPEIMEYRCNGCNRRYAEYVNGCPRCWIDEWSREKNYERYPNRHVGLTPRPIRLADVLIAFKTKGWFLAVNYLGAMSDCDMKVMATWDLHKDSLDDQSEETINLLYDILCNQNQSSK